MTVRKLGGVLCALLVLAVVGLILIPAPAQAQSSLGLPSAAIQMFQGMLLFFLLAVDVLTGYRIRFGQREAA